MNCPTLQHRPRRGLFAPSRTFFTAALLGPMLALLTPAPAVNPPALSPPATLPVYRLRFLGDFRPVALNDRGEVAGTATDAAAGERAVLYRGGERIDLGARVAPDTYSESTALNGLGLVTGFFFAPQAGGRTSFLYSGGRFLSFNVAAGAATTALGINDLGQIVGYFEPPGPTLSAHAFLRQPGGKVIDLGTLGGTYAEASAVNNAGQIVGWFEDSHGITRAFVMQPGGVAPRELGSLGGNAATDTYAAAINDFGQVVGVSQTANSELAPFHAFLYVGGELRDLGTLGGPDSDAAAINDLGQIVGSAALPSGERHGYVYLHRKMVDLNSRLDPASAAGWTVSAGLGVNNRGQIVANAYNGQVSGTVILTP